MRRSVDLTHHHRRITVSDFPKPRPHAPTHPPTHRPEPNLMLPVQRKSRSQSKMRRSHQKLTAVKTVRCPNCGKAKLPHAACGECGYVKPGLSIKLAKEE